MVLPLGFSEGFESKIELQNADFHWLGSVVLSEIYALGGTTPPGCVRESAAWLGLNIWNSRLPQGLWARMHRPFEAARSSRVVNMVLAPFWGGFHRD